MAKFDWIEGLIPQTPIQLAVKELGKELANQTRHWPPSTITPNEVGAHFAPLLAPGAPRPSFTAVTEALRRLRWELERDFIAADNYARTERLIEACPLPYDQLASDMLLAYFLEAHLGLVEATQNRVKRKDLLFGLDDFAARLGAVWHQE